MKILVSLLNIFLCITLMTGVIMDLDSLRFGNVSSFSEERKDPVAVVNSKTVYKNIKEYQIVVKDKVKQGTARYAKLMSVCTKKYRKALTKVVRQKYVLVFEVGGISGYPTTDITDSVISVLPYIKHGEED